jgi:hypothetical protein
MQVSGPWPPYHFVHRLTRAAHSNPHATTQPVQPLVAAVPPVVEMAEATPVLV